MLHLFTWNVNGIRAISKKGFFDWFSATMPDILAVQEIKADEIAMTDWWQKVKNLELFELHQIIKKSNFYKLSTKTQLDLGASQEINPKALFADYEMVFHACSIKKGYSGTAIFYHKNLCKNITTKTGLGVSKFDDEGRITHLETDKFVLINGYYPQGGRAFRIPFKLEFYKEVAKTVTKYQSIGKKVILCGDLNTTVGDIDLARPNQNRKTTGCLPEERAVLNDLFNLGLIDGFRYFYSDTKDKYTYWDQITRARERNVGWRIDYFLVDKELIKSAKDCIIRDQVMGSDHCPVELILDI